MTSPAPVISLLARLAAAATGVQVGAATFASRLVLDEVAPLTLALLRYMIGSLCLVPFALASLRGTRLRSDSVQSGRRAWVDWMVIGLLGVGQFGALIALLNIGLGYLGAAQAALIFSLPLALTLLISVGLGRKACARL